MKNLKKENSVHCAGEKGKEIKEKITKMGFYEQEKKKKDDCSNEKDNIMG